jgi:hypothetical protein
MNTFRVRIVNDVTAETTTVYTIRDRGAVFFGLVDVVRNINRRRGHPLRASLHMTDPEIVLHLHSPARCDEQGEGRADTVDSVRRIEEIIWAKGR